MRSGSRFCAILLLVAAVWSCLSPALSFGAIGDGCCGCCRLAPAAAGRESAPSEDGTARCSLGMSRSCCGGEPEAPAAVSPAARWALVPDPGPAQGRADSTVSFPPSEAALASRSVAPPEKPPRALTVR